MEHLSFTLNAVLPLILPILLGYIINRTGLIGEAFLEQANKLVFTVFIPLLIFNNVYLADIAQVNWYLALFAFGGTIVSFFIGWLVCLTFPDKKQCGVIQQSAVNTNYSVIGLSLSVMLAGSDAAPLASIMAAVIVPSANLLSVVSLSIHDGGEVHGVLKMTLKKIVTNPLIIAVFAGLIFVLIRWCCQSAGAPISLSEDNFIVTTLQNLSNAAMPLSLVVLGAGFKFSSAGYMWKQITLAVSMRLAVYSAIALAVAYALGMNSPAELAIIISLFATPVAVSSAPMAVQMKQDGELAGQLVVWSTLFSAFSLFAIIFLCSALGLF